MITCICHSISRYVYNYLGGKHDTVWDEAIATLCTFGITVLWLGPCQVVFIWAFFNCFGLNFELWTSKFVCMEPFASLEVRERMLVDTYRLPIIMLMLVNIGSQTSFNFLHTGHKRQ